MPQLEELYSHGGGDAFRQRSLELGVFYGVFEEDRLVSVAGTHIVSDNERIAALGNVMTHPDYRGQGLATVATSAVCEELLDRGMELIGLSVSRSNEAAIRRVRKNRIQTPRPVLRGHSDQNLNEQHRARRFMADRAVASVRNHQWKWSQDDR